MTSDQLETVRSAEYRIARFRYWSLVTGHGSLLLYLVLLSLVSCAERQESPQIEDEEPEQVVNTDLAYPKNLVRWAYVTSRVASDPRDPFVGYRVVVVNPFGAHARDRDEQPGRGVKYAQYIYDIDSSAGGTAPGALRRVNLMVQDPDRYAATGGWGYASYDAAGKAIPVEPRADCLRCHTSGPLAIPLSQPR